MTYNLTNLGINLLLRAQAGTKIVFTQVQFGAGMPQAAASATALSASKLSCGIDSIAVKDGYATIIVKFKNAAITTGFSRTETGIFAQNPDDSTKNILFAYGSAEAMSADYIPASTDEVLETQFELMIFVGTTENVSAIINESLVYASKSSLDSHIADKGNPHGVTYSQTGAAAATHGHTFDGITGKPSAYPPSHDRRPARVVVGSSAAGYTAVDCDYLCDGTADQLEINAALAALPDSGGDVLLLDGTYKLADSIAFAKSNACLRGAGGAVIDLSADASYSINMTGNRSRICGLTLAGNSGPYVMQLLITASKCTGAEISDVRFARGTIALVGCGYSAVHDCQLTTTNSYNAGISLYPHADGTAGKFNVVAKNDLTGAYECVKAEGETHLLISNNRSGLFNETGVYIANCTDVNITGNLFYTTVGGGIEGIYARQSNQINITGNNIDLAQPSNGPQTCVSLSSCGQCGVSNNLCRNIQSSYVVISLASTSNALVSNNVMLSGATSPIRVDSCSGVTSSGNTQYSL